MEFIRSLRSIRISRAGVITLAVMLIIILAIIAYFFLRDESLVQKHKNTPAAQALIIEDEINAFTDMSDSKISLGDDFGKVVVVMSWASWCPQCGHDLETLGEIAKEYQGRDVSILAINRAEDKYSAERFLNTLHVPGELRIILDPSDHYFSHSEGQAMPETIVYRQDGTIALHLRGEVRVDELRKAIEDSVHN